MLTGDMPFHIKDYNHAVERFKEFRQMGEEDEIFRKKRFKQLPQDAQDFLRATLKWDPAVGSRRYRLSAAECLESEWIQAVSETYIRELTEGHENDKASLQMKEIATDAMEALI